jgi:hypothetical protein
MVEMRNTYQILSGNLRVRNHSEDLSVHGRIILELMLGKQGRRVWTGFIGFRIWTSDGYF